MPVLTPNQVISLHSLSGVTIFQFTPGDYLNIDWTRDQNNASTCDISLGPLQGVERLPDIAPWLHWATVWDGDDSSVLWSGPIQKAVSSRKGMTLNAKDHGAYLARTRSPTSKRWDKSDPAFVAEELWVQMIELQGLKVKPIAAPDPYTGGTGNRYDFTAVKDDKMLDQVISDLVNLGMVWTVVAGVPIIGPLHGHTSLATLSDNDFTGLDDLQLIRDGSTTYNDVLVRAEGSNVNVIADYYGQHLQLLKNLDHLSSVSDVTAAARAYLTKFGNARSILTLPGGSVLHPEANITIDQLIPGARFTLETQGIAQRMQLTQVETSRGPSEASVKITMINDDLPQELDTATSDKKAAVTGGGGAAAAR
jgi:hypothetical protein